MGNVNKFIFLAVLLVSFLSFGYLSQSQAGPKSLTDEQLEEIAAGQDNFPVLAVLQVEGGGQEGQKTTQFNTGTIQNQQVETQNNVSLTTNVDRPPIPTLPSEDGTGGLIMGNMSSATVDITGLVDLSDTVQRDVKAMDLVNSAESSVANGVNVWAGKLAGQAAGGLVPLLFNSQANVDQLNLISQNQSRSASLGAWNRFQANVDVSEMMSESFNDTASVTAGKEFNSNLGLFGFGVNSKNRGRGAAGAGNLQIDLSGGSFSFKPTFHMNVTGEADLDILGLFDIGGEVSLTTDVSLPFEWDLPSLNIDADGAAVLADEGADASATRNDTASASRSTTINSVPTAAIQNARAEYIMGDDSSLDLDITNTVMLTGEVQQNAKAMNIVNAASSVVGNGVNVAWTSGLSLSAGSSFNLNQTNAIIQRR